MKIEQKLQNVIDNLSKMASEEEKMAEEVSEKALMRQAKSLITIFKSWIIFKMKLAMPFS